MALIAAAAILDGLDGRVARILDAQSRMGEEIDSLADAVNFGVTPALVVYVTLLSKSPAGWVVVLLYAVCVVLRLARYNALQDDGTQPAYAQGVLRRDARAGGRGLDDRPDRAQTAVRRGLVDVDRGSSCIWITGTLDADGQQDPDAQDARRCGAAELGRPAAGGCWRSSRRPRCWLPYILIWVIIIAYLCHIPFAVRNQRWLAAHPEAWADKPKQRRAARRAIRRAQPNRRSMARLGLRKPGGRLP